MNFARPPELPQTPPDSIVLCQFYRHDTRQWSWRDDTCQWSWRDQDERPPPQFMYGRFETCSEAIMSLCSLISARIPAHQLSRLQWEAKSHQGNFRTEWPGRGVTYFEIMTSLAYSKLPPSAGVGATDPALWPAFYCSVGFEVIELENQAANSTRILCIPKGWSDENFQEVLP